MKALLRKLDTRVYHAERFLAGALFLVMALVMFVSVLHRIFSREEGRLAAALMHVLGGLGTDPALISGPVSSVVQGILTFLLCYAGLRTMKGGLSRSKAALLGVALTGGLVLVVRLLLWAFPNGLVWGPVIALCCMLWVGLLGASLATYEKRHLAIEIGEKIWPKSLAKYARAGGILTAAAMVGFLTYLSCTSIADHYRGWLVNHLAGNLLPTSIPKWIIFLIFPYTFSVMTLRFLGQPAKSEEAP